MCGSLHDTASGRLTLPYISITPLLCIGLVCIRPLRWLLHAPVNFIRVELFTSRFVHLSAYDLYSSSDLLLAHMQFRSSFRMKCLVVQNKFFLSLYVNAVVGLLEGPCSPCESSTRLVYVNHRLKITPG